MVSSSIVGLEEARKSTRQAIESLGVADAWLFEFNAVATGSGPASQYVGKARDCDLFVIVVGSSIRAGTEEEYEEAFRDNPRKILAVLLEDDDGTTGEFRDKIRDRHTYRKASLATMPVEVARAVEHAVRTGEVSRRPLLAAIRAQHIALRSLLSLPAGFTFAQAVNIGDVGRPVASLVSRDARIVLEGEPGAGKSDAALGALLAASSDFLPVLCRARAGASLIDLIEATFDGVRYTPGAHGIRQFLREGRLAVVIDGTDELPSGHRAVLLSELSDDLARYPRTPAVLVIRSATHPALTSWARAKMEPLADSEVGRLFDLVGHFGEQRIELFAKLGDLIRLPFWAPAIARFGLSSASAPELLDAVIDSRLRVAVPDDDVGRIRLQDALAYLAWRLRPAVDADTAYALDVVSSWGIDLRTLERFATEPAEATLERGRSSGMLVSDAGRLRFIHPLIAAYLAARHAIALDVLPALPEDDDVRSFIAALLPPQRSAAWLDVFSDTSPAVLLRALRLAGLRPRVADLPTDVARFDLAYQRLAPLGGRPVADGAHGFTTSALEQGSAVCLRRIPGSTPTFKVGQIDDWLREPGQAHFTCWVRNPFGTRWPEQLAGEHVVRELKEAWLRLDPGGSPFAPFRVDPQSVVSPRETLPRRVLAHVIAVAEARAGLIEAAGLSAWLTAWRGHPLIVVIAAPPNPRFRATWGQDEALVTVDDTPGEGAGTNLTALLVEPAALAYRDLTSELDVLLGGTLHSGSLRGPAPMDWLL